MVCIRIGITGTHGVGKSTLAQDLAEKLGLPLISERARVVAVRMGIRSSDELVKDRRLAQTFQLAVLSEQIAAEAHNPSFISGRTVLDCLAYWKLYGLDNSAVAHAYSRRCLIRPYDVVVYIPPEDELQADGFRLTGEEKRAKVDQIIRDLITQYLAGQVVQVSGSLQERLTKTILAINGLAEVAG